MGNYFHKIKTNINIPICVAAVILCLTLVSTYFVSGLFARYAVSGQGDDSARVAKFSIEGSGTLLETIEAELVPEEHKTVDLRIVNNSEVAAEYTITVTNETNNLPLNFHMEKKEAISGASSDEDTNGDADGITFTVQRLPGNHTDEYMLQIEWKEAEKESTPMGKVDYITVTVTAAQID